MIQSIGSSPASIYASCVQSPVRQANVSIGAQECFAVDFNKLFTPSELNTFANIKGYMESEWTDQLTIQRFEARVATSRLAQQKVSGIMSIKEIVGNEIKAISDGYLDAKGVDVDMLKNIYENFSSFQGLNITA